MDGDNEKKQVYITNPRQLGTYEARDSHKRSSDSCKRDMTSIERAEANCAQFLQLQSH